VGSTLAFKLFRRLEPGENPEVEVGRFLTSRTPFRAMSALEGSLTYVPVSGEPVTLGVLQTWIDNQGDGWSYVLSALGEYRHTDTLPPRLTSDLTRLGAITADFHAALESDDSTEAFRPEPVQPSDIDAWSAQLLDRVSRISALIEPRLGAWPDETRRLGASFLAKPDLARAIVSAGSHGVARFKKLRIHGDYHLGQTLKTPSGFAIIDFEGEPATPIAVRREKHSVLRDVAGMLRSFEYALETAFDQPSDTSERLRTPGLRDPFLEGYFRSAAEHRMASLAADRSAIAQWLTFFELDKALYELEYEVNNRPRWAHIPLRGILRALGTLGA
jgi:maltose alpha-D-glucosyltransferase/alpha-amylase